MQVDYLVMADAAAAESGKHYIHGGGWDTINATSFPATHPQIGTAIRLRVPWNDTNQPHDIALDVLDEDGNSILPNGAVTGTVNVGRPPNISPGRDQVVPLVINLLGLTFGHPGEYALVLRIDGFDSQRSPFQVVDISPRQGA